MEHFNGSDKTPSSTFWDWDFYTHIFLKNFQYLDVFTKHIYASLTQNFEVWLPPKDSYQYQNVFSNNIIQYIMLESQMI